MRDELRRRSSDNVHWLGQLAGEEKRRYLANCRGVLLPSLWEEPLGIVTYEAFEQARPVFGSCLGGIQEIITDGVTGRLLPPGDQEAWLRAILTLDAPAARRMGAAGRLWLEENTTPASWNRSFNRLVQSFAIGGTELGPGGLSPGPLNCIHAA